MQSRFRGIYLLCYFAFVALCFAPVGRAQLANLDQLGEKFAKQLKSQKPKLIAVADFTPSGEALPSQGHYFAEFLARSIEYHSKKKLPISDHSEFDAALAKAQLTPASFSAGDARNALAGKVPQDIVVIGVVGRGAQSYNFEVSALRVSDGKILFSQSTTLLRSGFVDSFSEPFPPKVNQPIVAEAGTSPSVSIPSCIHCPPPLYSDFARREKMAGTCVFKVLISPEGLAVGLQPVKMMGYGLDEQAFNSIKSWRFKAAVNSEGTAVYVIVPIEVTFRLY